jgi:hypothetical protein
MVSKLKEFPFHKVNSPLAAPVITLLASGVHLAAFIGHRTLFNEMCTNLVATAFKGPLGYAIGGSN